MTVGLTSLVLAALSAFCWYTVPPISHGPVFAAQFTVFEGSFYANQSAKTVAYEAGCLTTPFLLFFSFLCARRWTNKLSDRRVDLLNHAGTILYFALLAWCALPMLYCPDPPLGEMMPPFWYLLPVHFSHPFWTPVRTLLLLTVTTLGFYFVISRPSRRNMARVTGVLLTLWAVLIPCRFYVPCQIDERTMYTYHLNTLLDAMSQSVNGHHYLVDFPHIYGGYGEFLAPIIRLFPRGIGVVLTALAIPYLLGTLCLLLTARLVIRRPTAFFVCGLALLGTEYAALFQDHYYAYSTARLFFPSVGLLAATLYFRRESALGYASATVVAALAPLWNMDTGFILWAVWLGTLLVRELPGRNLAAITYHLLVQILALIFAWAVFLLYLRLVSGQWPDGRLLFYFQELFVHEGYFCLRLLVPDMWIFVLLIYLTGLAIALGVSFRGKSNGLTASTLMISLLGIGLFSYFMGRSAPANLVIAAYPAILLVGLLWAECDVLLQRKKLPADAGYVLLPLKVGLFWWAFLFAAMLPDLLESSSNVLANWRSQEQTPLLINAAFIEQQVQPREKNVFILSDQSGIYYYLSGTARMLRIPGMIELFRMQDMHILLNAIKARQISKLFVDQNFYDIQMYRPDIYQAVHDAIGQNYEASQTSPTGRVTLYRPR